MTCCTQCTTIPGCCGWGGRGVCGFQCTVAQVRMLTFATVLSRITLHRHGIHSLLSMWESLWIFAQSQKTIPWCFPAPGPRESRRSTATPTLQVFLFLPLIWSISDWRRPALEHCTCGGAVGMLYGRHDERLGCFKIVKSLTLHALHVLQCYPACFRVSKSNPC